MQEEIIKPQRTTKNYKADMSQVKEVAKILNGHAVKFPKGFSSDIRKFTAEALSMESETKNYTPERCAKLIAAIRAYLSINKIEQDGETESLLEGFSSVIVDDEILTLFANSASSVLEILRDADKRVFMEAEVYYIDEIAMRKLVEIEQALISLFTRKTDKRRFNINRLVNLLNPDSPSHRYSVRFIPKFQQISSCEALDKYFESNYIIWRNTKIKSFNEMLDAHKFDENTKARLQQTHDSELERAQEEHDYIVKNFDNIDVRISGYEHETLYPSMSFSTLNRTYDKHLRSEVPNVLWFVPRPFRTNMGIKDFIENSQHAYGNVYYINTPKDRK